MQEQRILASLVAEQGRAGKTEAEIKGLRKTAEYVHPFDGCSDHSLRALSFCSESAGKLSKVGDSLADIAAFIDMTEIEHGVLPEHGKESTRRVNALRSSALRLRSDSTSSTEIGRE